MIEISTAVNCMMWQKQLYCKVHGKDGLEKRMKWENWEQRRKE